MWTYFMYCLVCFKHYSFIYIIFFFFFWFQLLVLLMWRLPLIFVNIFLVIGGGLCVITLIVLLVHFWGVIFFCTLIRRNLLLNLHSFSGSEFAWFVHELQYRVLEILFYDLSDRIGGEQGPKYQHDWLQR